MHSVSINLERRILFIEVSGNCSEGDYVAMNEAILEQSKALSPDPFDAIVDVSGSLAPANFGQIKQMMVALRSRGLRHSVRVIGNAYDVAATLAQIASTVPNYSHHEVSTREEAEHQLDLLRAETERKA